jgi:hypothetical protein
MYKFKLFLNFSKEEKWLNEMAKKGYQLEKVTVGYHFHPAEPEDTRIRVDIRFFPNRAEYVNYCTMFEDSGWKHIAGSQNTGVQYFKQMAVASDKDIFSDTESKAQRYIRSSRLMVYFALFVLFFMVVLISNGSIDIRAFVNPRLLYLTPGLWEKTGETFWNAFWFETPFALFRAFLLYFYPVSILAYLIAAQKTRLLYKKEKEETAGQDLM